MRQFSTRRTLMVSLVLLTVVCSSPIWADTWNIAVSPGTSANTYDCRGNLLSRATFLVSVTSLSENPAPVRVEIPEIEDSNSNKKAVRPLRFAGQPSQTWGGGTVALGQPYEAALQSTEVAGKFKILVRVGTVIQEEFEVSVYNLRGYSSGRLTSQVISPEIVVTVDQNGIPRGCEAPGFTMRMRTDSRGGTLANPVTRIGQATASLTFTFGATAEGPFDNGGPPAWKLQVTVPEILYSIHRIMKAYYSAKRKTYAYVRFEKEVETSLDFWGLGEGRDWSFQFEGQYTPPVSGAIIIYARGKEADYPQADSALLSKALYPVSGEAGLRKTQDETYSILCTGMTVTLGTRTETATLRAQLNPGFAIEVYPVCDP